MIHTNVLDHDALDTLHFIAGASQGIVIALIPAKGSLRAVR